MEDNRKEQFINFYMSIAQETAKLSRANRLKVGAIIVKDTSIISYGFNGTPPGWDNNCEEHNEAGQLVTKKEVLHAEENSILKVAKSHESCKDASLFVTHSPCHSCARMIIASGIKEVFFRELYRDDTGLKFLEKAGVKVTKV